MNNNATNRHMHNSLLDRGCRLLDRIYEAFPRDPKGISATMAKLLQELCRIRREMPREQWECFCKEIVPNHALAELIREDPFTLHSIRKPRGYPGDAMLLDYIYGLRPAEATRLGRSIFDFTTNTPPSRAVRERARIIAGIIDRVAGERDGLRVLSIACGHLREAELSHTVQNGRVAEYIAFDQDSESLAYVRKHFSGRNVRVVRGSVGELLLGRLRNFGQFDFVYAAGLYDYLSQKLATRLTTWMFNATRDGGITLLTNFLPETAGAGYMEAFMEWNLIYRNANELLDTASRVPAHRIADRKTYVEDNGMIVFVELRKVHQRLPTIGRPCQPAAHPRPGHNGVKRKGESLIS